MAVLYTPQAFTCIMIEGESPEQEFHIGMPMKGLILLSFYQKEEQNKFATMMPRKYKAVIKKHTTYGNEILCSRRVDFFLLM